MTPDDERHGTHAGAIQHWKDGESTCATCRRAAKHMHVKNQINRNAGRPSLVPLGVTAHNIISTTPRNLLARATGIRHERLNRYDLAGPEQPVHRGTRDKILTAEIPWTQVGIQRRLRALSALGWSMRAIADEIGTDTSTLNRIRLRDIKQLKLGAGDAVAAAYSRLSMTLPPQGRSASEARAYAQLRGWAPPLAWSNIDNPAERPRGLEKRSGKHGVDPVVVERVLAGDRLPMTVAERRTVVLRARELGWSFLLIEARTGITRPDRIVKGAAA